ncbi:MAG: hypothetical protein ACM3ZC_16600 [Bacteroidota bacterium]
MENILEVAQDGGLLVPAATVAEMGWGPGGKVLLRRTEDTITLNPLPMSAGEGARALQETVADLQGATVPEYGSGEVYRIPRTGNDRNQG